MPSLGKAYVTGSTFGGSGNRDAQLDLDRSGHFAAIRQALGASLVQVPRGAGASASIGLPRIEGWIADVDRTQATVRYLRQHAEVQGLLVPSMGFLDDPAKGNVVVYLDRVDPLAAFGPPRFVRRIVLEGAGGVGGPGT